MDRLSKAELRVAVLVARGHSNREIAAGLFLSVNTIKSHVARSFGRLGVRTRAQLVMTLMLDDRFRDLVTSETGPLELLAPGLAGLESAR
jgi:DNA-binding CsgD family transcriptional regulator